MIRNIIGGILIGIANIIPGVSGGTVALLIGVYEKLTEAIGEFFTVPKKKKIEFIKFLSQIILGLFIGIVGFAKILGYLYNYSKQGTSFFFIGLIVASLPLVLNHRNKKEINRTGKLWFLSGLVIMIGFLFLQYFYGTHDTSTDVYILTGSYGMKLVLIGVISGGAMVIPGISGSLLLMLFGEYYNILGFINNRMILPVALVGIGAFIGIVGFSKVIDKLLKSHKDNTLYFILGLIIASLAGIWPGFTLNLNSIFINVFSLMLGIYLVKYMIKLEKKKHEKK